MTVVMTGLLAMTVTGMTATGMNGHLTAVTVPDRPLVVLNMMTAVHPGLRPPGGRLTIEGLQGTMITGEAAMMTAEGLIIIMTDAGTILTDVGMTEDATRRMNASTRGLRGTQMGMAVGPVKVVVSGRWPKQKTDGVHQW
jgi:hypothetical protein